MAVCSDCCIRNGLHRQSEELIRVTTAIKFGSTIEPLAAQFLREEVSNEDPDKRIGKVPVAGPPGQPRSELPQ
jgi:hypothetical protein